MWEIHCNVRTVHGGRTYNLQAGVHDALPDGVGESLECAGFATRIVEVGGVNEFALDDMKVPQLKVIAKEMEIAGHANMKKDDLIDAIREAGGER